MQLSLDCIPCLIKQAATVAQAHLDDPERQFALVDQVMREMLTAERTSAPGVAQKIQRVLREALQDPDPYREQKGYYNAELLKLEGEFQHLVAGACDPLEMGMKLAVAGNIIDFGPNHDLSREHVLSVVKATLTGDYDRETMAVLKQQLHQARRLLYLGDNCGEIVLDKLFIRAIREQHPSLKVFFATRGHPTLNDVTEADAYAVGLDRYATIINNGTDIPGTILSDCSPEFLSVFESADVIIAKGQGNFESLYGESTKDVFFLFLCKCNVFEKRLGVRHHDIVFQHVPAQGVGDQRPNK